MRCISVLLAAALGLWGQARTPSQSVELFNSKDLSNFYVFLKDSGRQDPKGVFTVLDGAIRISGEEWGALATVDEWRDYRLIVEWRWGGKTFAPREERARDSGILVHGIGEDGAAGNGWLESIEYQIIEGGTGDLILVAGKTRPKATAQVRSGAGNQLYWQRGGETVQRESGRINWFGRDPAWQDRVGFRGANDIERPVGEWNTSEIVARGDSLTYLLNGTVVLEASAVSPQAGKIQIQSEGAEILIRRIELRPNPKQP